jgi:hypothetical protein
MRSEEETAMQTERTGKQNHSIIHRSRNALRCLLAMVLLLTAASAIAQTTGIISGVVTDKAGALVPSVQVAAKNTASGVVRSAVTNKAGEYSFPALTPGDYEITFTAPGFATIAETATLNVTEHIAVDTVMQVSSVSTTVEVSSSGALLDTESVTQGGVISGESVVQLPLATNNFTQLLALSPGVIAPLNDATGLGRGTQNVNVNGARTNSNSIYVDGVDAVNVHTNSSANNGFASNSTVIPPPDAIQEFKIQTALFDASTGRSGGSNVALITRSGTNNIHGDIYEFFRNTDLNANSYFLKQQGQPRPELIQNQFGASIGGPIRKDKIFYFFNYQGTRQVNGYPGVTSVNLPQIPTDRSLASLGAFGNSLGNTSYTGPKIAANGSNISPVAVALLQLKFANGQYVIPSPQTTAAKGANYVVSTPATFNEDEYTGSTDYQISMHDHIAFHVIVAEQPQFQSVSSTRFVPGFGLHQRFRSRLYSVAETHVFSSNVVNDLHIGLNRALGHTGLQNQIPLSTIGMTRFNSSDFSDIPEIEFSGSFEMGYTVSTDQADTENTWQYFDNLSWLKGKHNMTFGVEMRRYQDNYFSNNDMRGTLDFISFQNFMLGETGAAIAQGGNGTNHSDIYEETVASGLVQRYDRIRDLGLYAQDSWHPLTHLTINAGLRWEYIGLPTDIYGRNGAFDPRYYVAPTGTNPTSAGFVQAGNALHPVPGIPKVSNTLTDNVGKLNFAPRFGIAYQMNKRQVIRAGYGLFYDRLSNQLGLLESLSLPTYVKSTALNSGGASTYFNLNGSLANPFPVLPQRSQFPILPQLYPQNVASSPAPVAINDIDPMLRTPYYQQWGLNIQTALSRQFMFEVGYIGARGEHLAAEVETDQAKIASASNPVNGVTTNNTGTTDSAAARAPYIGFANNGFLFLQTNTWSNFNSLQVTLQEKLGTASLLASYMYSKSLDVASGSTDGTVFNNVSGDQTNFAQAYGPSDFDRTQHATIRFVQPIPHLHARIAHGPVGRRVFEGYELSGTGVLQTGSPITITNSGGAAYYGTDTSRGSFVSGGNTAMAVKHGRTEDRLTAYFNDGIYSSTAGTVTQTDTLTGAAPVFATAGNLYGNTGRNILRGPTQRVLDLSLTKYISLVDGYNLEFRAQAFNISNTPNFANPSGDAGTATTFGSITATQGNPRILQFALKLKY